MKKYIPSFVFLLCFSLFCLAYSVSADVSRPAQQKEQLTASSSVVSPSGNARMEGTLEVKFEDSKVSSAMSSNIFTENWGVIVLGLLTFAETIVRITPTQKDNSLLKLLVTIFNSIIPNKKKSGGVF